MFERTGTSPSGGDRSLADVNINCDGGEYSCEQDPSSTIQGFPFFLKGYLSLDY